MKQRISQNDPRALNKVQPLGFSHGMKLNEGRLAAEIHKQEQSFVVLGTDVTQQVVAALPLRFVAKRLRIVTILQDPATQAAGFYFCRSRPCCKCTPELFAFCRCHYDAYALDDQLNYLRPTD